MSTRPRQLIAFRALPAVILGGLDSVPGALVGGLAVGLAESSPAQLPRRAHRVARHRLPRRSSRYVVMIVVLLVRPYGLFGTPEIRRV